MIFKTPVTIYGRRCVSFKSSNGRNTFWGNSFSHWQGFLAYKSICFSNDKTVSLDHTGSDISMRHDQDF